ncbi:radical SAM protein [Bradyrhizobium sp. Tv2a-2]|uniref:B12-binding domain-containing radical SAM protein n=1 Tax=Bradyrhizobium sp. Tv2a-2 TaxID=113395 RepID=UPI0004240F99|nr:radical SAM protein [Bradyrhizobium sp. Tv2a-2]
MQTPNSAPRRFQLALIKPSHYGDDGYVIRWWRAIIPSNSLAAVYGAALDCIDRQVLGPGVNIDLEAVDEFSQRIEIRKLVQRFRRHNNFGLVALVGVQSNQYPRALDLARPLRSAGVPVAIGGFHVSGCLSMLDGNAVGLDACRDMGVSIFAGEAEGRLEILLRDAAAGQLQPVYDFLKDLPGIQGAPVPFLPIANIRRTLGLGSSFDAGRGCPYQCSFCTIINVQGRKSRYRSPDDVEKLVRANWAQGVSKYFITDDNFARNKEWELILDRLIKLREVDGIPLGLMIQVDTLCHKLPNFIEKCRRAGVTRVFIGLENINPDNLSAAKKRQNKITEYRKMMLAWKAQGIFTLAGYILGFPADTPTSIRRDIEIIQRELPLDIIEFFCLTPLPGSEDHRTLWSKRIDMDPDLNKYDLEHVCCDHPNMTREEWAAIYQEAWRLYYSREHMQRLLRRTAATPGRVSSMVKLLLNFSLAVGLEGLHPLQGGVVRLRHPTERRPGLPPEPAWVFWPRLAWDTIRKTFRILSALTTLTADAVKALRDPERYRYTDQALTPVRDDDDVTLDLMNKTGGARAAVAHIKRVDELTHAFGAKGAVGGGHSERLI